MSRRLDTVERIRKRTQISLLIIMRTTTCCILSGFPISCKSMIGKGIIMGGLLFLFGRDGRLLTFFVIRL